MPSSHRPAALLLHRRLAPARRAFAPGIALAAALALLLAAPTMAPALSAKQRPARVTLTKLAVVGSTITVTGRVSLPASDAKLRKRTLLTLTLAGPAGRTESFTARLDAKSRFNATHLTRLSGALGLWISVRIAGRSTAKKLLRHLNVNAPAGSPAAGGAPSAGAPGTAPSTGATPGTGASAVCPASSETVLNGTFELQAGTDVGGTIGGSWFEMSIKGGAPLQNPNSPLANQDYTPLSPGSAGGLQTFAYEPAPSPAFADPGERGNALAADIMKPQGFEGYNFSVVTEPGDRQALEADPEPHIVEEAGRLSGQLSAWVVGWNGEWFNQGSPKPNGTLPEPSTALTGTCDATSGHYVLEWKSLIVGGPFNGDTGSWHLEGTFVPAA